MKLSEVDKTYKFVSADNQKDLVLFDVLNKPFSLHGMFYEEGKFKRLPLSIAKTVSDGVVVLHSIPAGGRVKFKTNSQTVALFIEYEPYAYSNQPISASAGFDIFADGKHVKSVFQNLPNSGVLEKVEKFSSYATFKNKKFREITVYFPIYSRVRSVMVGIKENSEVKESKDYKDIPPIVYYGSSITQGCCSSKPSTIYEAFIERWTKTDFINFGFAGNCRGEKNIVDYISKINMSAFVLDYDYNSTSVEQLNQTHYNCYKTVRENHPNIPIIMLSRPEAHKCDESIKKRDVIKNTYLRSLDEGDKKTAFIDGHKIFGKKDADVCTVEGCHPTDLGFYKMAKKIYKILSSFDEFKA